MIDWPEPKAMRKTRYLQCPLSSLSSRRSRARRRALRQALGAKRLEYLLALLAFIKTAHYWTETHPALEIEEDVRELMALHEELASLLLQGPDLA